ncbi:ABC transporter substrate-binding protein [Candidimonas humi]|uniref:ABC transporter substrate-binding protein n=1 Tax=Candidimonas humi TaxID=683355 RepID=A0ABV8P302_9BURK|nr:ABC transporter substrate-binding protein [Candidimonas humi]MBV6306787.1 ABC transporter substrate-binding protein [Candidimonas humi]
MSFSRYSKFLAMGFLSTLAVSFGSAASAAGTNAAELHTVEKGQILYAFRADDKPVSFIKDDKPAGFMVDLTTEIAKRINLKPEYVATDFSSMVPSISSHRYDSAAFAVLVTPPREKVVNFTTPVNFAQARLVSLKKAPLQTVKNAGGKTVAITVGSALIPVLQKLEPTISVRTFPNIAASTAALKTGQVSGLFTGFEASSGLLKRNPDFMASESVMSGKGALPVAKDRPALLKAMNTALGDIIADGTYMKLYSKWYPGEGEPAGMAQEYPNFKK